MNRKLLQEIIRPTFEGLPRPLREFCGCITYSRLLLEAEVVKKYGSQLKPGFLKDIARFADPSGDVSKQCLRSPWDGTGTNVC